jgi:hypothetical protein
MTAVVLDASAVFVGELSDIDVFLVAFAQNTDGSGWSLELQRPLSDADSVGYCIVLDGGPTCYACLKEWHAEEGALTLHLTPDGAEQLGVEPTLVVVFPSTHTADVVRGMKRVRG